MNEKNKQILLDIARTSVLSAVTGTSASDIECNEEELNAPCGCFVTLKNGEDLRGCIGQFISEKPLYQLVGEMGIASATHDSRFFSNPVTADELDEIDIELSILSPLEKTDNPSSLRLGVDGIYIVRGPRTGCFLPQVATETGWTREEFLSYCCSHKAGLEPNAWKYPETEVYLFTADVFSERLANRHE